MGIMAGHAGSTGFGSQAIRLAGFHRRCSTRRHTESMRVERSHKWFSTGRVSVEGDQRRRRRGFEGNSIWSASRAIITSVALTMAMAESPRRSFSTLSASLVMTAVSR
jgi:hypothetical protein